jgi:hypothetical protein
MRPRAALLVSDPTQPLGQCSGKKGAFAYAFFVRKRSSLLGTKTRASGWQGNPITQRSDGYGQRKTSARTSVSPFSFLRAASKVGGNSSLRHA